MPALRFTVYGVPVSKGNLRAIHMKGMQYPVVTESNRSTKSWQQLVAEGASRAIQALPSHDRAVLDTGVRLTVAFYMPRPKKYRKRGVEPAHVKKPDCSKLLRAVEDALTKVAYLDDAQVVDLIVSKRYASVDDAPHVDICVEPAAGTRLLEVKVAPINLPLFDGAPESLV